MSGAKSKYDSECGFCGKFLASFAGSMADVLNVCTCPNFSSSSLESMNNDGSSSLFDLQQWDDAKSYPHLHAHSHPLSYPQSSDILTPSEYPSECTTFDTTCTSSANGLVAYNDSVPSFLASNQSHRMMMSGHGQGSYDAGAYEAPPSVRFEDDGRSRHKPSLIKAHSIQCCSIPGDTYDEMSEAQNDQDGSDNCIINCWYDKKNNSLICSYEPREDCDSDSDKSSESLSCCAAREEFGCCTTEEEDDEDFPSGPFSLKLCSKDRGGSTKPPGRFFGPSSSYLKRHRKAIDIGRRDMGQFKSSKEQDECSLNTSLYSAGISLTRDYPKVNKYHGEYKKKSETKDMFANINVNVAMPPMPAMPQMPQMPQMPHMPHMPHVAHLPRNDDSWLKRAKDAVAKYVCEMETNNKEMKEDPLLKADRVKESPVKTEVTRTKDSPARTEVKRVKDSPAKARQSASPAKRPRDSPAKLEGRRNKESPTKVMIAEEANILPRFYSNEVEQIEANKFDEKVRREREAKDAIAKCIAENEERERREKEAKEACVRRLMEIEENVRREKEAREAIARRLAENEENARKEKEAKEALAKCMAEREENARKEIQAKEMIAKCIAITEENARKERMAKEALAKCLVESEENAKREQQAKDSLARRCAEKEREEKERREKELNEVAQCIAENEANEKKERQAAEAVAKCIAQNEENERKEKQVKEVVGKCLVPKESKESFAAFKKKNATVEAIKCIAENLINEEKGEKYKIEEYREKLGTTKYADDWCMQAQVPDGPCLTRKDSWCMQDNTMLCRKDSGKVKKRSSFSLKLCPEKKCKKDKKPKCTGRICHSKVCSELCNLMTEKEFARAGEHDRLCKASTGTDDKVKKRDRRCNHSSEYWAKENRICNREPSPERTKNLQIKVSFKDCLEEACTPAKVDECNPCDVADLCGNREECADPCKKDNVLQKVSSFCLTSVCKIKDAKRRAQAQRKGKKCRARLNADLCPDLCEFVCKPSKTECGKLVCKSRKPRPSSCCNSPKLCLGSGSRASCSILIMPDVDPCDPCGAGNPRRKSCERSCSSSNCKNPCKKSCSSASCNSAVKPGWRRKPRRNSCSPTSCFIDASPMRSPENSCKPICNEGRSRRRSRQRSRTTLSCSLDRARRNSPLNISSSCSLGRSRPRSCQRICTPPSCCSSKSRQNIRSCTPSRSSIINKDPCFMMSFDPDRTLLMPVKQCWSKRSSREIIEDAIRKLEDIEKKSLSGIVTPPRVCSEEPEFYDAIDSAHMNTSESNSRETSADASRWCRRTNSRGLCVTIPSCNLPTGRSDSYERKRERCKTPIPCLPPCSKKDSCEGKRDRFKACTPPCEKKVRCKAKARSECRSKRCDTCKKKKKDCGCPQNS